MQVGSVTVIAPPARRGLAVALAERAEAPRLYRLLRAATERIAAGERHFAGLETEAARELARHGWVVDYVSVRSRSTLLPPAPGENRFVILAAARLGTTRLIDNIEC